MKKIIAFTLCSLGLFACSGKKAPDSSMVVIRNESLRLPPEFEVLAPTKVETIVKTEPTIEEKSQELLMGKAKTKKASIKTQNSWLLKKAGAEKRIKNIKSIIAKDIAKAEEKAKEDK